MVVRCLAFVVGGCLLRVACWSLFWCCSLLLVVVCCLLFVECCLMFVVCCSLRVLFVVCR